MIVGDGKNTSFWHDKWCGAVSLADKFPSLYEICEDQYCSVAALKQRGWRLKFRRWLHEELQNQLRRLHDLIFCFNTNDEKDVLVSSLSSLHINFCVEMIMVSTIIKFGKLKFL